MKYLKVLTIWLLITILLYFIGAFGFWQLNPALWTEASRFVIAGCSLFSLGLLFAERFGYITKFLRAERFGYA